MSVDATEISYLCPFCDEEFSSERKVRLHVKSTEEGDHQGVNGFEMDRVIETEIEQDYNQLDEKELHNKIAKAPQHLDAEKMGHEEAELVAEEAGVPKSRVARVWKDEDITVKGTLVGRIGTTKDQLSDPVVDFIDTYLNNDDLSVEESLRKAGEDADKPWYEIVPSVEREEYIDKYKWMWLPLYDGSSADKQYEGEVKTNSTVDEMMESVDGAISTVGVINNSGSTKIESDTDVDDMNEIGNLTPHQAARLAQIVDEGTFHFQTEQGEFDLMADLIEAGDRELAEELFDT